MGGHRLYRSVLTLLASITLCAVETAAIAAPSPAEAREVADDKGANWAAYGRTSSEDHFSPLTQIDDKNIGRLGLAWSHDLNTFDSFTAPLAIDGVLYFAVGGSVVHAMDARSGKLLWKYDPQIDKVDASVSHKMRAGWGVRGIAFKDGKVFTGTRDGRLLAIDAKNGKLLWSQMTLPVDDVSYITGPPWIAGDKVVIGFGGADYGPVRGYVTAYDIATGKQAWRFYTVPGDPAKGFENKAMEMAAKTWTGEWWKYGGGGSVYHAMAYDARYDRIYLGTGNGWPWNQKIRSPGGGDNLYLSSIVALDAKTGEYVWHYQVNPGNSWDFNNAMDIELADLMIDGKLRPVILHAPKNGFFYVIDRETGRPLSAEKFTKVNWAESIDLKTGRPVENPDAYYKDGKPFVMYPWPTGAHSVQTMSFSPKTGMAYFPVIEGGRVFIDPPGIENWQYKPGGFVNTGLGAPPADIKVPPATSSLLAWDVNKQKAAWSIPQNGTLNGGTIATAGNLVFQGLNTGEFVAYAADSGKKLWGFDAQNGMLGNAITYTVGGKQYVTIITGFRSSFPSVPNWDYRQQKRRVLTFALDGKATLPAFKPMEMPILDNPEFVVDEAKAKRGAGIYGSSCIICHGAGLMAGGAAPDLRRSPMPMAVQSLDAVVRGGALMASGMPQFNLLAPEDIEGLQHFIRQQARAALTQPAAQPAPPK